jgi:hypothetical protein
MTGSPDIGDFLGCSFFRPAEAILRKRYIFSWILPFFIITVNFFVNISMAAAVAA